MRRIRGLALIKGRERVLNCKLLSITGDPTVTRFIHHAAVGCLVLATVLACSSSFAADITFNISYIAESDPLAGSQVYGDVWTEGGFVYVGSDVNGGGMNIFSLSNAGVPTFLTRYAGDQMEDVEVYDGIGYFSSDVSTTSGTGVDIVDLSIPFDPIMLSRVNGSDGGHNKVHTLSVSEGYLYTVDNNTANNSAADFVRIFDVHDPENPQLIASVPVTATDAFASHEVVVRNDRMYVASKNNSSSTCCGWVHIFDVANPAAPVLLKAFLSGARTHTAMPSEDGNLLIVAEERLDGDVKIYDISMIDQPNDPQSPVLKSTLNDNCIGQSGNCFAVGIDAHTPHHPHLHGNLLFLTWYEAGLQVFNIADPSNPVHVGAFDTYPGTSTNFNGNWGVDLSLGLSRVLLSDRSRGLIVVNATGVVAAGDYDQDMNIDADDYIAWREAYGSSSTGQHGAPLADGNYNGVADAADYVLWRKALGAGSGGGSVVPEPASGMLLLLGLRLMAAQCRARRGF
jgi:hypothetical protein